MAPISVEIFVSERAVDMNVSVVSNASGRTLTNLLIIGGSDAGIAAGLRAREVKPSSAVTVLVADAFPNYSICGLPFYISGETPDWRQLAHRSLEELNEAGLDLRLDHVATAIDPVAHQVQVKDREGRTETLAYERLVIATGAQPVGPAIPGLDLLGVFVLHTMDDSFRVHEHLASTTVRDAAIVGAGYIGLEMADALTHRQVRVTLLSRSDTVLPTVDPPLGRALAKELRRCGVVVHEGVAVEAIEPEGDRLTVRGARGVRVQADLVLVGAGVRPNSDLAASAGVKTALTGAIRVDRRMATNLPDVYAAGDCVETWHRVLNRYTYLPLGTTAHKQALAHKS